MAICFVEYRIEEQFEAQYRAWMAAKMAETRAFLLYEGTDQPLLFVEVWEADDESHAADIKEERCSERSSWHAVAEWVAGGATKIHAWTFRSVSPPSSGPA
ncbi:hypothetical protein [Paenibacillus spongiae]|uniref:DUF4286 family protein n=1 Tax=Paenibacillus spongiae TaxID=2909671 RepID=A0ABY5SGU6_9BACL|nr:hypothetical protein [Paenibacillus spongiae]UVI31710.1 hypothetical protein L1F29_07800 [Paenibacillus spongiae]